MSSNCGKCLDLGYEIDKLIEQRSDLLRDNDLLKKFIEGYKDQRSQLTFMLRKATVRLGICLGRMQGCHENSFEHSLSLEEIPPWVEEQTELVDEMDPPSAQDIDRRCLGLLLESKASEAVKRKATKVYEERYGVSLVAKCDHGVRLDEPCSGPGCGGQPVKLDRSKTRSA